VQSPNCGLGFLELLSEDRYYVEVFWHAGQCSKPPRAKGAIRGGFLPWHGPLGGHQLQPGDYTQDQEPAPRSLPADVISLAFLRSCGARIADHYIGRAGFERLCLLSRQRTWGVVWIGEENNTPSRRRGAGGVAKVFN
jgi:hypothetical protein